MKNDKPSTELASQTRADATSSRELSTQQLAGARGGQGTPVRRPL